MSSQSSSSHRTKTTTVHTTTGSTAVFKTTDATRGVVATRAEGPRVPGASTPARGPLNDPLTGLANEHLLLGALSRLSSPAALVIIEVDQIGLAGTCFGPPAERSALTTVAHRLERLTPPDGLLGRTGSQEFAFLLPAAEPAATRLLALDIERQLLEPITIGDHSILPTPRIGIALTTGSTGDGRQLLRDARLAAGEATNMSGGTGTVYSDTLRAETIAKMQLQAELSLATDSDQLRLEYQPIISIESGKVTGFEALLRWDHPVHGTIQPDEVIPLAEETGLIGSIGEWVLVEACRQMATWQQRFPGAAELTLHVNLSGHQLDQPDLVHRVLKALQSSGLRSGTLRLELTEEMIVSNAAAIERLEELQRHGIEIQLDDFGSGYSSLDHLSRLPVDSLKLDRTFVERCETDPRSATILHAMVSLARELDLAVTAEGIETREQAERIRALACETGQGFFFHRPLDEEAAERLLVA